MILSLLGDTTKTTSTTTGKTEVISMAVSERDTDDATEKSSEAYERLAEQKIWMGEAVSDTPNPPDEDGPECSTCGKTTCPDADLPQFYAPVKCAFQPIYEAINDSKDCDYGCSRDYTNQAVTLWMVPAIEEMLKAARAESYQLGIEVGRGGKADVP